MLSERQQAPGDDSTVYHGDDHDNVSDDDQAVKCGSAQERYSPRKVPPRSHRHHPEDGVFNVPRIASDTPDLTHRPP